MSLTLPIQRRRTKQAPTPDPEWVKEELLFIAHLSVDVLGYTKLGPMHLGWFKDALMNRKMLFLAPRDHFKTTCFSIVYPIYNIIRNRSIRILLVNEVLENAKGFLREIKAHLQRPDFQEEFGSFAQDARRWSSNAITVPNDRMSKDPTVGVAGTLGAIVSRHVDLLIGDDIISNRNSQTISQRRKIKQWFAETLLPILEPKGQLLITGTRWHSDDQYNHMLQKDRFQDWKKVVLQALKENGQPLFPERFSRKELLRKKTDMGSAFFNSQYMNDPTGMEGARFKFDWLEFYEDEPKTMKVYQGVDLAISEKNTAAYFALVTIGISLDNSIYLLEYRRERLDFPSQCRLIKSQIKSHRPILCGIEDYAYQKAMVQWLNADPEAKQLPFKGTHSPGKKPVRLGAMAPLFERGVIKIRKSMHEFIEEYLAFPQSGTFDLLDALEIAISVSREQEVEPQISVIDI